MNENKPVTAEAKESKANLYRVALREAIALLVLNGIFTTEANARQQIMAKAKKKHGN